MTTIDRPAHRRRPDAARAAATGTAAVGRSAPCCCATSPCCARTSRSSSPARSCSRSCWCSCSPTCSRRSARASAAAAGGRPAFSTVLVAGVVGHRHPLPGHPGGGPAAGAGVRLHPGDRGPRPGPAAGRAGGDREDRGRRAPVPDRRRCIVFPIATVVPATPVHLDIHWPMLLTLVAARLPDGGAARADVRHHVRPPHRADAVRRDRACPITFLGCIYYPWQALEAIRWLQIAVLVNPLVYMSEGFRAALTDVPHMSLWVVYPVMIGFTALFTTIGIRFFKRAGHRLTDGPGRPFVNQREGLLTVPGAVVAPSYRRLATASTARPTTRGSGDHQACCARDRRGEGRLSRGPGHGGTGLGGGRLQPLVSRRPR